MGKCLRLCSGSGEWRKWSGVAIVLVLFAAYVAVMFNLALARHHCLYTQMNDLGNMTQAIWSVSQGDLTMRVTNDPENDIRSRLGVHGNFVFYLFAVPFALVPGLTESMQPLLLLGTTIAAGLGGFGIYCFARYHLAPSRWIPVALAVAYWLNPMVHDASLYDFHVITFASAFIVWMLYAWEGGYNKTGWALFALAILCKEDISLILLALGLGEMIWRDRKRGIWMGGLSLAYIAIYFGIIMPVANFGDPVPEVAASRFAWLGETPREMLMTVLTEPLLVLGHVLAYEQMRLPVFLYLIGGVIALFGGWRVLLGAIPPVGVALLADYGWMTRITGTYYWIPSVSLMYLACALALKANWKSTAFRGLGTGYLLVSSFGASVLLSQTPLGLFSEWEDFDSRPAYRQGLSDIKALIPEWAAVSAQNNIGAHLAKRRMIGMYPRQSHLADFLVFHLRLPRGPDRTLFPSYSPRHLARDSAWEYRQRIRKYSDSSESTCRYFQNGFVVFERESCGQGAAISDKKLDRAIERFSRDLRESSTGRFQEAVYGILGY